MNKTLAVEDMNTLPNKVLKENDSALHVFLAAAAIDKCDRGS
jgi:hypothetical protein